MEAVAPCRDNLDACLVFPSMPAVMKLNKLGTFSMAQLGQSKSLIGDFIKSARKASITCSSRWETWECSSCPMGLVETLIMVAALHLSRLVAALCHESHLY